MTHSDELTGKDLRYDDTSVFCKSESTSQFRWPYLCLDTSSGCRSDTWCEDRSSICPRSQEPGCCTLSWPAELLLRRFVSSLRRGSTSPTVRPPEARQRRRPLWWIGLKVKWSGASPFLRGYLDVDGAVLVGTHSLVAHFAVAAAGAVRPGEVSGLADQLAAGLAGAPQFGARLHVRAGFGARAKGQLALTVQVVAGTGQVVRQGQLFLRLIQETVSCGGNAKGV